MHGGEFTATVPFFEVVDEPGDETWWEQEIKSKPADKKPESKLRIDLFLIEMIIIQEKDYGFQVSMPTIKNRMQSSELFLNNKIKTEFPGFFACRKFIIHHLLSKQNYLLILSFQKNINLNTQRICKK